MTQSGHEGGTTGTDGAQGSGQQGNGDAGSQSGTGGTDGTQSGADGAQQNSGDSGGQDTVSRADFERIQAQLRAADQKREQAEKSLKDIQDKDLSELEKAKQDLENTTKRVAELESENYRLKLGNAFLSANTITWQNGDVALDIAERQGFLDGVQDEKTGVVDTKKLAASLKRLSEEHSYLVKKDTGGDSGESGGGASGESGMGRGGKGEDAKAREDRLRRDFPALGRR